MEYFLPFQFNDSFKGVFPKGFPGVFAHIYKQAKEILKERSEKEIDFAFKTINFLRDQKNFINFQNRGISESEDLIVDYYNNANTIEFTPATALLERLIKFDISDQNEFPNATYADYFAVLALGLIGVPLERPGETEDLNLIGVITIYAMEAIGFAKGLHKLLEIEIEAKNKQKIDEIKIKRHGKTIELQKEFINYYLNGNHPSRREAAKRFYENLSKDKQALLVPDNAVRTLTDCITNLLSEHFWRTV